LLLFKHCDQLSQALPEAHKQWLREYSRRQAQSNHDAVHQCPAWEDVAAVAAEEHQAQSLRGVVLALLTEAPPQLAEDLTSLYVAWSEDEAEQMDRSIHNYALLCTSGSKTPSLVFNRRARAHIRHPVSFQCSGKLKDALLRWSHRLPATGSEEQEQQLHGCSASDVRSIVQASFGTSNALSRMRTSYACFCLCNGRSIGDVAHWLGFSTAHVERLYEALTQE
jgi:hypothetical protein